MVLTESRGYPINLNDIPLIYATRLPPSSQLNDDGYRAKDRGQEPGGRVGWRRDDQDYLEED